MMATQTVAEKLGLEKGQHELKLGKSFEKNSKSTFHTVRYDFKPASVDTNQESKVNITDDNAVTVTVPHVQGAGTTHTVYKGNKRPLNKECVLIINHDTGEIVLEKFSHAITLKKTRQELPTMRMSSQRPVTPIDKNRGSQSKAPVKPYPGLPSRTHDSSPSRPSTTTTDDLFPSTDNLNMGMEMSSSSSSSSDSGSSSDSDSHSDDEQHTNNNKNNESNSYRESYQTSTAPSSGPTSFLSTLSHDLSLSESDSDSD